MSQDQITPEVETEQFVSKYYEMDPETDDLLFDGTKLKNEMRVLIASPSLRHETVQRVMTDRALYDLRGDNRWCFVSEIEVTPRQSYQNEGTVSFVALYDDGTKRKRVFSLSHAWIVKKDSIPADLTETSEASLPTIGEDHNYGAHLEA